MAGPAPKYLPRVQEGSSLLSETRPISGVRSDLSAAQQRSVPSQQNLSGVLRPVTSILDKIQQESDNIAATDAINELTKADFDLRQKANKERKGKDAAGVTNDYLAEFEKAGGTILGKLSGRVRDAAYRGYESRKLQLGNALSSYEDGEGERYASEVESGNIAAHQADAMSSAWEGGESWSQDFESGLNGIDQRLRERGLRVGQADEKTDQQVRIEKSDLIKKTIIALSQGSIASGDYSKFSRAHALLGSLGSSLLPTDMLAAQTSLAQTKSGFDKESRKVFAQQAADDISGNVGSLADHIEAARSKYSGTQQEDVISELHAIWKTNNERQKNIQRQSLERLYSAASEPENTYKHPSQYMDDLTLSMVPAKTIDDLARKADSDRRAVMRLASQKKADDAAAYNDEVAAIAGSVALYGGDPEAYLQSLRDKEVPEKVASRLLTQFKSVAHKDAIDKGLSSAQIAVTSPDFALKSSEEIEKEFENESPEVKQFIRRQHAAAVKTNDRLSQISRSEAREVAWSYISDKINEEESSDIKSKFYGDLAATIAETNAQRRQINMSPLNDKEQASIALLVAARQVKSRGGIFPTMLGEDTRPPQLLVDSTKDMQNFVSRYAASRGIASPSHQQLQDLYSNEIVRFQRNPLDVRLTPPGNAPQPAQRTTVPKTDEEKINFVMRNKPDMSRDEVIDYLRKNKKIK